MIVTLYTRKHCLLCDKAKAAMELAEKRHGLQVELREVDIDGDPELRERFTNDVPVIYIGQREAFRHRVNAEAFAAAVRETRHGAAADETPNQARRAIMPNLASEKCIPCRGGVPPMPAEECEVLRRDLGPGWRVVDGHHLEKEYTFANFVDALALTNRVGAVAEAEGHHPDIYLAWGKVRVTIWTHKIDGLTRSDFVLAAKIDQL
jgi:4a-hydroxytetrahydrobiopterin dehydratase